MSGPVIVHAVLWRGREVLLARRSPRRTAYPGLWSFPGGHVEPGEDLTAALKREVAEEIGVEVVTIGLSRTFQITREDAVVTHHAFSVEVWRGEPRLAGDEHSGLAWTGVEQAMALPDLAMEDFRDVLAALDQARG